MLLLLCMLLLACGLARAEDPDCYNVTQPSLARVFNAQSPIAQECRATGDVGPDKMTCHESCLNMFVRERQSYCFARLQLMGHTCQDLLGLVFSSLSLSKTSINGCKAQVAYICRQHPTPSTYPWHNIIPMLAGSALGLGLVVSALLYAANRLQLHRYDVASDDDNTVGRGYRSPGVRSPEPSGSSPADWNVRL